MKLMREQESEPCLWLAISGFKDGTAKDFVRENIHTILPDFHLPELSMPLRSTRSILTTAGLEGGKSSKPLLVCGSLFSNIDFTIPPQLIHGVESEHFFIKNPNDQKEVEMVVKQARESMASRLGTHGGMKRGVPVLSTYFTSPVFKFEWIINGIKKARNLSFWSFVKNPNKQYTLSYRAQSSDNDKSQHATEVEVMEWLDNMAKGVEERDLLTDEHYT